MEPQYIHLDAVRTSLQVIAMVPRLEGKDWLQWSRPAALSTNDPTRNVQGGWKTAACKEVEAALKKPSVVAQIQRLFRR